MISPFITFLLLTAATIVLALVTFPHIAHELRRGRRHH